MHAVFTGTLRALTLSGTPKRGMPRLCCCALAAVHGGCLAGSLLSAAHHDGLLPPCPLALTRSRYWHGDGTVFDAVGADEGVGLSRRMQQLPVVALTGELLDASWSEVR